VSKEDSEVDDIRWQRRKPALLSAIVWLALSATGCGSDEAGQATPCEEACQDAVALRAVRETMKFMFNITLQAQPVGAQDVTEDCATGGSAHIFGEASSVPEQGATLVDLTYEFDECGYLERDDERDENYSVTISAVLTQRGTLAVQPSATTAIVIESESLTLSGTVSDPPIDYTASECALTLAQNGDELSGTICGREAGLEL
jgi:hypothetical protein